jgi:DNA-nicking Smr family endonuclease
MAKQRNAKRTAVRAAAPAAATAADALTFRAAVRDVKPLAQSDLPQGLVKAKPRARRAPPVNGDDVAQMMPLIATAGDDPAAAAAPQLAGGDALSFQRAGVRTQVLRRLRRGLYPIDAELDLHGLSQSAARDQLANFIAHNRDCGSRCVRIIHGKGYRSGARGPVLKIAVNTWLRRHLDVMAFTSARAIDGGTGAVYVLLRA